MLAMIGAVVIGNLVWSVLFLTILKTYNAYTRQKLVKDIQRAFSDVTKEYANVTGSSDNKPTLQ